MNGGGQLLEIEGPDFIGLEELTCRYHKSDLLGDSGGIKKMDYAD